MHSIISKIMSTPIQPQLWYEALDSFNKYFELPSSALLSFNCNNHFKQNIYVSDYIRNKITPDFLTYVESDQDNDTEAYKALLKLQAQKLHLESDIILGKSGYESEISNQKWLENLAADRKSLPDSALRNFMEENGLFVRIASRLNLSGPWMDGFFIHCKTNRDAVDVVRNSGISIFLPMISGAVELGRCFEALRQRFDAALSVLDNLGMGVFLINQQGNIISSNREAQRIIDQSDGLNISSNNKLKVISSDVQAQLTSMIYQANGLLKGDVKKFSELLIIPRLSEELDYLVAVRPMLDSAGELEKNLGCAFVTVIDPSRKNTISVDGLAALGLLTAAENDVVRLIVNGFKTDEIADERKVSLNTVRSQIKTISSKLNCSSQSDIIRTAVSTKIPIIDLN